MPKACRHLGQERSDGPRRGEGPGGGPESILEPLENEQETGLVLLGQSTEVGEILAPAPARLDCGHAIHRSTSGNGVNTKVFFRTAYLGSPALPEA